MPPGGRDCWLPHDFGCWTLLAARWWSGVDNNNNNNIPSVSLGVPNTISGHCGKTEAILKHVYASESVRRRQWLLIADDDTIINLRRLRHLLACYHHDDEPVVVGERYGYSVNDLHSDGYNYITGGGGMVFNWASLKMLATGFHCQSMDNPDDMLLGMFFRAHDIPVTHSPYFHQARPEDYSEAFLASQIPVSFHKHWLVDPYSVYERLQSGGGSSEQVSSPNNRSRHSHDELKEVFHRPTADAQYC